MKRPLNLKFVKWLAIVLLLVLGFKVLQKANQPPFGRIQVGTPIQEGAIDPQVVVHRNFVVFLSPERELYVWGGISEHDPTFEVLTGFSRPSLVPIPISHDFTIRKIVECDARIIALLEDGTIRVFGDRVVRNNQVDRNPYQPFSDSGFVDISAGINHVVGLKEDGTIWAWGNNDWDQLGQGRARDEGLPYPKKSSAPLRVGLDTDWAQVKTIHSETYALKKDGSFWTWGNEPYSNPAPGNPKERPLLLSDKAGWIKLAPSYGMVLGLHEDGSLWLYGKNLPRNEFWEEYEYVASKGWGRLGKDSDWVDIVAGEYHMFAKKKDGSWWGMGSNQYNQLALDPEAKVKSTFPGFVTKWVKLPDSIDPWAIGLGLQNTVLLTRDGQLWNSGRILGIPERKSFWKDFASSFNRNVPVLRLPVRLPEHHSGFHRVWSWPPKPEESFYVEDGK